MYPFNHGGPSPGAPPPSADGHPSSFRLYTGDPYPGAPPLSAYGHPSSFRLYTATPTLTPYGQFSTSMRFTGVAGQWSTGLCHCCDDPAICFITCLCPCITFGRIAEIVSKGSKPCYESGKLYGLLLMTGFACLYSCFYRSKLRMQYDLEEDPCTDCLVHFCCETCALSQEYRELKNRGFDMGIGWEANMDRQKRAIALPPIVTPGMTR